MEERNMENGNLLKHAERELAIAGYDLNSKEEEPNKWMSENVIELISVFANQGHSGSSAPHLIRLFSKLANFEALSPLTGEDSEWNSVTDTLYQNNRCSHVFKENGVAYDGEGKIFRDPDGSCWQNLESRTPVTFPYTPTTVYVDRTGGESGEVKGESQCSE